MAAPMARLLIVGGGCRGLELARLAGERGHAVRIVTRRAERAGEIERAGAECLLGDPDRLATLRPALDGIAIACWLLGTAGGEEEKVRALHRERLRAFLGQMIDSTARGFVYESAGTVAPPLLAAGAQLAQEVTARNSIPMAVIESDPADRGAWLAEAGAVIDALLAPL